MISSSIPCDSECHHILRNKRVADALNIATDVSSNRVQVDGVPVVAASMYTDFLKSYLKTNHKHVSEIENALVELVQSVNLVCFLFLCSLFFLN